MIKQIQIDDYLDQLMPLISAHGVEVYGKDVDPDLDRYRAEYACVVGMFDSGVLVGYCSTFVLRHGHLPQLVGIIDAIYLRPEHRKGRNAMRLLESAEQCAKDLGAASVIATAKAESNFARILSMKYVADEICFVKDL